jgi:hypothetical protein
LATLGWAGLGWPGEFCSRLWVDLDLFRVPSGARNEGAPAPRTCSSQCKEKQITQVYSDHQPDISGKEHMLYSRSRRGVNHCSVPIRTLTKQWETGRRGKDEEHPRLSILVKGPKTGWNLRGWFSSHSLPKTPHCSRNPGLFLDSWHSPSTLLVCLSSVFLSQQSLCSQDIVIQQ